jgi:vacuolar-type H+-ATPase subunit I/STV1
MRKRFPRRLFGLEPKRVDAELLAEQATHRSMIENARRLIDGLTAEERTLQERIERLRARKAHLDEVITTMTLTAERDQRIAARAEERFQQELQALEGAHRRQLGDLRREEASLRALLHRDVEQFRALVARLRAAVAVDAPGEEPTPAPMPITQVAVALEPTEEP